MKRDYAYWKVLAAAIAFAALQGCQTTKSSPIDELSLHDGLERVDNKTVDALFRRPGADLSVYSKLLVRPLEVQFAKNWDLQGGGSALYRMNEPDRERIRRELAELFAEVTGSELAKGGYPLVSSPGSDVVELQAAIVNLYITAPDVSMGTPARTRVYTTDAGEMTLIMELHDSVTGQLLARAYDRRQDSNGQWRWTTSVTNSAEARRVISVWAGALRKAFDAAHAGAASAALSAAP